MLLSLFFTVHIHGLNIQVFIKQDKVRILARRNASAPVIDADLFRRIHGRTADRILQRDAHALHSHADTAHQVCGRTGDGPVDKGRQRPFYKYILAAQRILAVCQARMLSLIMIMRSAPNMANVARTTDG